jgi:hypothetical protein
MLNLKTSSIAAVGAVCLALSVSESAQAAQLFDFSYSGSGVSASGQLTTTDPVNNIYTITGITGQRNGVAIGSLASGFIPFPSNTLQLRTETVVSPNFTVSTETFFSPNFAYRLNNDNGSIFYVYQQYRNSLPPRASYSYYIEDIGRPPVILDSFSVRLTSTTPIPTPALLPGLMGLGFAALRKKPAISKAV